MTRTCTQVEAYAWIEAYLRDSSRFPWKTARYLSRKLREERQCRMPHDEIETMLHDRMQDGDVRYSQFPGRKSLDLLWGHRAQVGSLRELWDTELDGPRLEELVGEFEDHAVREDGEWVFLSHAFDDVVDVRAIRERLLDRGYGVWIAETEISDGEPIVKMVQAGLERSDLFALYATQRSLTSRWVLKEGAVAASRWNRPATLIVDSEDPHLVAGVRDWVRDGWTREGVVRLLERFPNEPVDPVAPTSLDSLFHEAFGQADTTTRSVVLFPGHDAGGVRPADDRWYLTLEEAFPGA